MYLFCHSNETLPSANYIYTIFSAILEIFINSTSRNILSICICSFSELSRNTDEEFLKLMCSSTSNKLLLLLSIDNKQNEINSLMKNIITTFVNLSYINSDNYAIALLDKGLLTETYKSLVIAFRNYRMKVYNRNEDEEYDEDEIITKLLTIVKNIISISSNRSYKKLYNSGLLSLIIDIFRFIIVVENNKDDKVTKITYIVAIFQSIINKGDINTINEMIRLGLFDLVSYTMKMIEYNNIVESSIYIYDDILGVYLYLLFI